MRRQAQIGFIQWDVIEFRITDLDVHVPRGLPIMWRGYKISTGPLDFTLDDSNGISCGVMNYELGVVLSEFHVLVRFRRFALQLKALGIDAELMAPIHAVLKTEGKILPFVVFPYSSLLKIFSSQLHVCAEKILEPDLDPLLVKISKDLKLVCCPRLLAATLAALPSMSLIPLAPLKLVCCPRSLAPTHRRFTFCVAHPTRSIETRSLPTLTRSYPSSLYLDHSHGPVLAPAT
jgi:hypothetical protein